MNTNQTAFALVCGAIDAASAWWLLGRLKLSVSARVWLTVFFGAGTVMWFESLNGGSWDVTQIVAVGFTLGALGEVFGDARPAVVGLLAGLASLAQTIWHSIFRSTSASVICGGRTGARCCGWRPVSRWPG